MQTLMILNTHFMFFFSLFSLFAYFPVQEMLLLVGCYYCRWLNFPIVDAPQWIGCAVGWDQEWTEDCGELDLLVSKEYGMESGYGKQVVIVGINQKQSEE